MLMKKFTIKNLLLAFSGAVLGLSGISQFSDVLAQSTVAQEKASHSAKDLQQSQEQSQAHIPLTFHRSSSISISTKPDANLVDIAQSSSIESNSIKISQTSNPTSNSPDIIRQRLLIRPITTQTQNVFIKRIYTPSLNTGTPVAFGLETGDAFIGVFGATAGRRRDTVDGSVTIGTGLGDASKYFAVEGVFNINSIRNFGSNGSFDLKVHRLVYEDFYKQIGVTAVDGTGMYQAVTAFNMLATDLANTANGTGPEAAKARTVLNALLQDETFTSISSTLRALRDQLKDRERKEEEKK